MAPAAAAAAAAPATDGSPMQTHTPPPLLHHHFFFFFLTQACHGMARPGLSASNQVCERISPANYPYLTYP